VSTAPPRTVHPFHMWDGIEAIPVALGATEADGPAVEAAAAIAAAEPRVDLVGCGTSYFAGMAIAHAFQGAAAMPATAHNAFEYAAYPPPAAGRGALVALSHTGTTPDVVAAVEAHRAGGRPAIALTDVPGSPLAAACDGALVGPGGLEPALPKTRSYATALQRGYALALAVARRRGGQAASLAAALAQADDLAAAVIRETEPQARRLAEAFAAAPRIVVIGGGPELATANEAALKITEAAGMHADAWEVEEAAHGTWASTGPGELAIVIAPEGRSAEHARRIARGMATAGASVWTLGNGGAVADEHTALPDVDELVMPLFSVLPLYAFAYHLALIRGRNPDVMGTDEDRYREARGIMRLALPTAVAA
jgi:glucosamine--fructose-6-phosphate aminotransferase (isomerizing)